MNEKTTQPAPEHVTDEEIAAALEAEPKDDTPSEAWAIELLHRMAAELRARRAHLRTIDVELDHAGASTGPEDGRGTYTADGRVIALGLELKAAKEQLAALRAPVNVELAAVQQAIDALPAEEWIRAWFEDGEPGEGPYGVHPGSPGSMVESNDVITRPTEEEPDGRRVCECADGKIAAFVVLARKAMPRLVAELRPSRAAANVEAEVDALCQDPRYVNIANVYIRALATPLVQRAAVLAREAEGLRAQVAQLTADYGAAQEAVLLAMTRGDQDARREEARAIAAERERDQARAEIDDLKASATARNSRLADERHSHRMALAERDQARREAGDLRGSLAAAHAEIERLKNVEQDLHARVAKLCADACGYLAEIERLKEERDAATETVAKTLAFDPLATLETAERALLLANGWRPVNTPGLTHLWRRDDDDGGITGATRETALAITRREAP